MAELVGTFAPNVTEISHPLLDNRATGAVGIVVVAADKGLCGSYNSNILRAAHQFIDRKTREMGEGEAPGLRNGRDAVTIVTVGRKATDYFTKRGYKVSQSFAAPSPQGPYDQIRAISNAITGMFLTGEVDEVHIATRNSFRSSANGQKSSNFCRLNRPVLLKPKRPKRNRPAWISFSSRTRRNC